MATFTQKNGFAKVIQVIFVLFSLLLLGLLANSFFQQDEWHSFGLILGYGKRYLTLDKSFWQILLFERIGSKLITYWLFNLFDTNAIGFGILAWLLHVTNSLLVYLLTSKLIRNKRTGLLAGSFFLVSSVSHQGYSWFGTMVGTTFSVTLMLLSLISYLNYLFKPKKPTLFLSLSLLTLSFFFKETALFIFLLYPLIWIIKQKQKITLPRFLQNNAPTLILGVLIITLFTRTIIAIPGERANYVEINNRGPVKLLSHLIRFPTEGSIQIFLPASITFPLAQVLTRIWRPDLIPETSEYDAFYQTQAAETVSVILLLFFIFSLYKFSKKYLLKTNTNLKQAFSISLIFLILSFLPYTILSRFDAYLESRYYYAPAIGAALLLAVISQVYLQKEKRIKFLTYLFLIVFLMLHALLTVKDLYSLVITGQIRKKVLADIVKIVPKLPLVTIFYITGNSPGFYGLPELKVPFQSGLGHVLMVEYARKGQLSPKFFTEQTLTQALDVGFLYDIVGQGYKIIEGKGFGYFLDGDILAATLTENKLTKKDIIPLFYDADLKKIELRPQLLDGININ